MPNVDSKKKGAAATDKVKDVSKGSPPPAKPAEAKPAAAGKKPAGQAKK